MHCALLSRCVGGFCTPPPGVSALTVSCVLWILSMSVFKLCPSTRAGGGGWDLLMPPGGIGQR